MNMRTRRHTYTHTLTSHAHAHVGSCTHSHHMHTHTFQIRTSALIPILILAPSCLLILGWAVEEVFGSPGNSRPTNGTLCHINSVFASPKASPTETQVSFSVCFCACLIVFVLATHTPPTSQCVISIGLCLSKGQSHRDAGECCICVLVKAYLYNCVLICFCYYSHNFVIQGGIVMVKLNPLVSDPPMKLVVT